MTEISTIGLEYGRRQYPLPPGWIDVTYASCNGQALLKVSVADIAGMSPDVAGRPEIFCVAGDIFIWPATAGFSTMEVWYEPPARSVYVPYPTALQSRLARRMWRRK